MSLHAASGAGKNCGWALALWALTVVLLRFVYKRNIMKLLKRLSFLLNVPLPKDSSVSQNWVRAGMAGLGGRKSNEVFLLQLPL